MKLKQPQYLFPDGAEFGADNLVLHAKGRRHVVKDFAGPLSIKTVISGEVSWIVAGRNLVVDASSFLVLSDGQKYSMDIDTLVRTVKHAGLARNCSGSCGRSATTICT